MFDYSMTAFTIITQAASKAHRQVRAALREGSVSKPLLCQKCGTFSNNLDAHHASYSGNHALDVLWLCRKCHFALHAAIRRQLKATKSGLSDENSTIKAVKI